MAHHGQVCFGTERIIVHEKVKDEFTRCLVEILKEMPSAGNAVTADGAKRACAIIEEAVADGAEFLFGASEFTGISSLRPSILMNLNPKSRINREEAFAPSASLYVVKNDEEAVSMANDTPFGLSASVSTSSYERGLRLARELDFGQVQINSMTIHVNRKF